MSSIPCKFQDKCYRNNCPFSHESTSNINPALCKYGEACRSKNCAYRHLTPPRGIAATQPNGKNNVNWNHSNGRSIDHNMNSLPHYNSMTFRSENHDRQRHHSSQSDISNRTSPITTNTRARDCRLGAKCRRWDCYWAHPDGRDIERVENSQRSITELIDMIDILFFKAEEELQQIYTDEKECDDEQVLEPLREDVPQELRLQRNEFQSAIENLITEFNSILSSTYDVLQFQRIHKQLERELKRWQSRLPIYARRSDIIEKLKRNQVFILKGDTGSGKSTQIVQYLCDEHLADQSK